MRQTLVMTIAHLNIHHVMQETSLQYRGLNQHLITSLRKTREASVISSQPDGK